MSLHVKIFYQHNLVFGLQQFEIQFTMREIPSENRPKLTRFADQNQPPKANGKTNSILAKTKSGTAWGSNIVKGFTTEKKTKQQFTIPNKKLPLTSSEVSNQKNQLISYHTRVKQSLIGDFPCSANVAQVHPHVLDCHRSKSSSSRDLFLELDHLRSLLRESKERELKLQAELQEYKGNLKSSDIERELDLKRSENDNLIRRIGFLEAEKTSLSERLGALSSIIEAIPREESGNSTTDQSEEKMTSVLRNLEMEVVELRRVNKELHLQKRNLTTRLSSAESQLSTLAKVTEVFSQAFLLLGAFGCALLSRVDKDFSAQIRSNFFTLDQNTLGLFLFIRMHSN